MNMFAIRTTLTLSTILALLCLSSSVSAQQQNRRRGAGLGNFDNPTGIAIHPETGDIFVAEHRGIFRIFQDGDTRTKKPEVRGFPTDHYGKGPIYEIGPLGIAFLGNDQIVVGDGSRPDTEEVVLVYKIGETAPERPAQADTAEYTLGPLGSSDDLKAEGNYYAVVVTDDAIYATANGDDTKGWIVRAKLNNGVPGKLERFIATKEALQVDAPVALTTNSEGKLVVGQMGEITLPGDSLLAVFDSDSGELIDSWETGLNDITGLAYSPSSGKLYATDFSWLDTTQGGLFELTVSGDSVDVRKVRELDKPTAIAFDSNGNAYVTILGTAQEGSNRKPGRVVRIGRRALEAQQ
jgi:DNA-binding beta-propeller fold protein YncE